MLKLIIVVLKLAGLNVSQLGDRVKLVVDSINANPYFVTPNPALALVTAARLALADAETAYQKAKNAENKAIRNQKREELMALMEELRGYVQVIARTNPAYAEAIAYSAGMYVKSTRGRGVTVFGVKNAEMPGVVLLATKYEPNTIFTFQKTQTPDEDDSWETIDYILHASILATGLTSGKRYYFRVLTKGFDGAVTTSYVVDTIVL